MKRFSIIQDTCSIGFQTHALINLEKSIEDQLHRRKLFFRSGLDKENAIELIKIIEWNSSLRIAFGWSFESTGVLDKIMGEAEQQIIPKFTGNIVEIISDNRCDWIGFVPFNNFDRYYYETLCIEDLITFNNNLIDYQISIVKFLVNHQDYRYHAMVRDEWYRYNFFKKIRKNPIALASAFQYYVDSVMGSSGVNSVPRDIIEQMIGCHYLYHPDVFFESLNFNVLKGTVHE